MRISDWSSDVCSSDLAGTQVAAGEAEVGVDHADQGQPREMVALGDDLRADDHVDLAGVDRAHELGGLLGAEDGVGRGDLEAGVGKPAQHLLGQPLDAGAAGDEAVLGGAGRARSEEHTSELQSLMRNSYAVFCLKKKTLCT